MKNRESCKVFLSFRLQKQKNFVFLSSKHRNKEQNVYNFSYIMVVALLKTRKS